MESTRQKKFAKLIQQEMSSIFQREMKGLIPNTLLTITVVRVTPDFSIAKLYLSFLPEKNGTLLIDTLRENTAQIRNTLGKRIRHQVRVIPMLQFYIDDTEIEASKIDALIDSLHIPPPNLEE
jgi:ribosome-binding factor A